MKRQDVIREIMTLRISPWSNIGFQMAKSILLLSEKPPGTVQKIGTRLRLNMGQDEAARIVTRAKARIALVDEGG